MKSIKKYFLIILLLGFFCEAQAQKRAKRSADEDTREWRYEIECVGVGEGGNYLVKIWSFSRRPDVAAEQAKKNAIHGVIFKGIPTGERGCFSQPPLARSSNLEQEKQLFFDDFFAEGGKYQKFVDLTTNGSVAAGDRLKISRREYKIGIIVSVNKNLLRQDLEDAGVLRSLSSGF